MNDAPRYATVGDYLKVIRDQRWLVLLTTVIFAVATYAWSERQTPLYEAEAALEYRDPLADFALVGTGAPITQTPEQRAAIGARTANALPIANRVRRSLDLEATTRELQGAVSANAEVRSNLVIIQARWREPREAARIANAFATTVRHEETREVRSRFATAADASRKSIAKVANTPEGRFSTSLERQQIARLEQLARLAEPVEVVSRATAPTSPVTPRTTRNTVIAAFLGLALGLALAFLRTALDRRITRAADVAEVADYPVLGSVRREALGQPLRTDGKRGRGLDEIDLEQFRIVRTNIDFLDVDRNLAKVLVTSALPEEGKSTVAASIAVAAALAGRRTLLVECDLRAPVLWKRFGINATPGVSDFLVGNAAPAEVLQTVPLPYAESRNGSDGDARPVLVCITAGSAVRQPAELLSSSRFAQFVEQVSAAYDTVVLDTTPLLSVVDALELVQYADAVVLCARAHQTTRDELKAAKQALERLPERPTGVVVTGIREGEGIAYGYYGDRARTV